jgi:ATP-dependent Clp protease adapter protein ClpS
MSQSPTDRPAFPPHRPAKSRRRPQPTEAVRRQLPRYKLILHYDSDNELMYIVRTVMELTRLCRHEATHKMWESYHSGRSVLLITYKERAELYVEQFASRRLTVTIEPDAVA